MQQLALVMGNQRIRITVTDYERRIVAAEAGNRVGTWHVARAAFSLFCARVRVGLYCSARSKHALLCGTYMHWTVHSWRGTMPSPWLELVLAVSAVLCGAIVGAERERQDKPAGLRTLILVCLGSAVFTMASYAFTTSTADSGRVAAQIVTGIGFLGAGAILHSRTTVSGMTTAAAIWIMAAVGMTIGIGRPVAGAGLAILVRGILAGVRRWEIRHLGGVTTKRVVIQFDPDHGKTLIRLNCVREDFHVTNDFAIEPTLAEDTMRASLEVCLPRKHLHEFLQEIVNIPAVREIGEFHQRG